MVHQKHIIVLWLFVSIRAYHSWAEPKDGIKTHYPRIDVCKGTVPTLRVFVCVYKSGYLESETQLVDFRKFFRMFLDLRISKPASHARLTKLVKLCRQTSSILERRDTCNSLDITSLVLNQHKEVNHEYMHGKCFVEQVYKDLSKPVGTPVTGVDTDGQKSLSNSEMNSIHEKSGHMHYLSVNRRPMTPERLKKIQDLYSKLDRALKTP
ncbi:hypothetical protein RF11_04164 [Thelohanellus kitauei]|uniref:Uncharacterized protein n=1 Tax=Thelohanellus kitauei TaxID=669202 RepID=A0A0C2MYY3_THEKT|nr:hypothetical protein RF11_04164 [Thelohanellus kitauei]